jgi:hypothetical protein
MKGGLFMQVMGKTSLSFCVRILTDAIIAANIGALLFLPPILKYTYSLLSTSYLIMEDYTFLLVFLYICGVLTLGILVLGHFILRNIEKEQPFSGKNAKYFKLLGINFLLLSAIFFVKIFMYNTILTIFCALFFMITALLSWILSGVFKQASLVWEEHQLVI